MSTHQSTQLKCADAHERSATKLAVRSRTSESHLRDLVEILSAQTAGLHRWSVMRAMRNRRERDGRDVPHKFEDEVERTFRNRCAVETPAGLPEHDNPSALFYRPKERAGEVWAVFPERAKAWLCVSDEEGDAPR